MENYSSEKYNINIKGFDILFVDKDNNILGQPVYTRWEAAKWYQRLLGFFFKRYKMRFVDYKGFSTVKKHNNNVKN